MTPMQLTSKLWIPYPELVIVKFMVPSVLGFEFIS